jgi:hypothetical protein
VRFWTATKQKRDNVGRSHNCRGSGAAEGNSIRFSHFSWWLPSMCVFIEDLVGLKAHIEDSPTQGEASAVLVFVRDDYGRSAEVSLLWIQRGRGSYMAEHASTYNLGCCVLLHYNAAATTDSWENRSRWEQVELRAVCVSWS